MTGRLVPSANRMKMYGRHSIISYYFQVPPRICNKAYHFIAVHDWKSCAALTVKIWHLNLSIVYFQKYVPTFLISRISFTKTIATHPPKRK